MRQQHVRYSVQQAKRRAALRSRYAERRAEDLPFEQQLFYCETCARSYVGSAVLPHETAGHCTLGPFYNATELERWHVWLAVRQVELQVAEELGEVD